MSAIISFIYCCCNCHLDFLCLGGAASVAGFGVASVTTFGVASAAGSAGDLYLRPLFPVLNNNPKLLKKRLFSSGFVPCSKFFNSIAKLSSARSAFPYDKYNSSISLKNNS